MTSLTKARIEPHPGLAERLRRRALSVRVRIVVGSILLLLAALASSVVVVRQMLMVRVDQEIEREMAQEVEELRSLASGVNPGTGQLFGENVSAILSTFLERNVPARDEAFYAFVGERPYLSSFRAPSSVFDDTPLLRAWTGATTPTRIDADSSEGSLRSLAVPLLAGNGAVLGTFVVAIFPASDRSDVNRVIRTVIVVALVVLVLGSIAAWSIAGRIIRPVRELTQAARATGADDLTQRIPVQGSDEIAMLGHTFNKMLDRLDQSFRSQRNFLDEVAHELRTPITIVRGHLEMLDDDPDERLQTIALVTDELDRMSRYVSDLLLVARSAQPNFLRPGIVDVGELLEDVFVRAAPLGDRRWVMNTVPPPGATWTIADGERITQALLALVTNSVEHTEPGDRIEIGARAESRDGSDVILIWVKDTGRGIDPADHEQLFNRFSRGSGSSTDRPEGTGLGLAIVSAIVRAHEGSIELDSALRRGATFRIVLPRIMDQEERV